MFTLLIPKRMPIAWKFEATTFATSADINLHTFTLVGGML